MIRLTTHKADETREFGKRLATCLRQGAVVALSGDLAAGKTTMIQGICRGLKVQQPVESPTYTLVNEYRGEIPIYHIDCYREQRLEEWLELGIEEYFYGDGITLVEWAERIEELLPQNCLRISIDQDMQDANCRYIKLDAEPEIERCIMGNAVLARPPREESAHANIGN